MSKELGAVKAIVGKFWIQNSDGEMHLAVVGEMLHEDDRIIGSSANTANSTLSLDLAGNANKDIVLGANDVLALDQTFLKDVLSVEDTTVQKASLVAAWDGTGSEELSINIEDNKDALALADTTAAGDGETAAGGAASDGQITPATFDERTGAITDVNTALINSVSTETGDTTTQTDNFNPNDAPILQNDNATGSEGDALTTLEDTALTIAPSTLLANDTDPDGDILTITSVQEAVNGTVALVGGNIIFTPNENYNGAASFTYTVLDGKGGTATATVNVGVTPVNDVPVATPSTSSGLEDATSIAVSLAGTDSDGTVASVQVTTLPTTTQGVLYYADGTTPVSTTTSLTPAEAASLVFKPALNFNGDVTIAFTVTDNEGLTSASANEVITVTSVNDAPTITVTGSTVIEDVTLEGATVATFTTADPDSVETVAFKAGTNTDGYYAISGTNVVLTAAGKAFLDADGTLPNVVLTVTDGTASVDGTGTIITTLTNDAPTITVTGSTVIEDVTLEGATVATFTTADPDSVETVAFKAGTNTNGYYAISGTNVVLTAAGKAFLDADGTLPNVVLTVTDGTASVDGTGTIITTLTNDAPTTTLVTLAAIAEDSGVRTITTTQLLGNASDVENNTLSVSNVAISSGNGTLVNNNNGTWSYTPAANDDSSVSFSYTITDNGTTNGASDPKSVAGSATLDITPVNDAPSGADKTITTNEDVPYVLKTTDFGFTDVDGNAFESVKLNLPTTGSLYLNGVKLITSTTVYVTDIDAGKLVYLPDLDASGINYGSFSFQVKDNGGITNGGIDTDQTPNLITFNVTPIADPISNASVLVGSPITNTINITGLNTLTSVNFANGVTVTSGSGTPFNYSPGNDLGVNSGGTGTDDQRIEGGESIVLSSVNGIQYVAIGLKNSSDDTVKFTGKLEVNGLGTTGTLSGTLTSTLSTMISSANTDFKLVLTFADGADLDLDPDQLIITNDIVTPGTGSANWSISYDTGGRTIVSATLVSLVNGNIFNQGGNASANMTFSVSSDMSSFAIAQGAGTENIYNQNNNGFQIEYLETSVSQNGISYSYPIDVYALVKDTVGSPETITALKLSDVPAGSQISIVVNGTYVEVVETNGVFDLSAYSNLLTSPTNVSGTDKIYLTTSSALADGFVPTMTLQTTDTGSTSLTILGGSTGSTLTGGDGNDYISGGAGNDTLIGGAGNDLLISDLKTDSATGTTLSGDTGLGNLDGGNGFDTLILSSSGSVINFNALDSFNMPIKNIEVIDLGVGTAAGGSHALLNLSVQDVMDMTDSTHTLTIFGDSADTVTLVNPADPTDTAHTWTKTGDNVIENGHTLDIYKSGDNTVTLKIEDTTSHLII